MVQILFIVKYTSGGVKKNITTESYKTAFEYFSEKESEGKRPTLYRQTTEVTREVLLKA